MESLSYVFTQAASWLISEAGIAGICSAILLWAVVAWICFWRRIKPIDRDLEQACNMLDALPENEESFSQEFESFDERIRQIEVLRHPWREFRETLILNDERLAICNVQSPAAFFGRGALVESRANLRFYNALPNLLTGTGILGTFMGLVAGIWLASHGLASQDLTAVRAALQSLLNGAALAFSTSIVGLVASILFSWREKHWLHRLDRRRQHWVEGLDRRLRRLTPEQIGQSGLQIARDGLQETRQQTLVLEQFTTDLAFQIAQAFEEKVAAPIGPVMERLLIAVEGLREDFGRSNDDLLRDVVEGFSKTMTGAAGQELTALGETLRQLNERLGGQIDILTQRQERMERSSQDTVSQLADVLGAGTERFREQVAASVDALSAGLQGMVAEISETLREASRQTADNLKTAAGAFDATVEQMREGLIEIERITTGTRQVLSELQGLLEGVRTAHTQLAATSEPIRDASREFTAAAQENRSASQQAAEAASQFGDAVGRLESLQEEVNDIWVRYEARFKNVDQALAQVFQQLEDGLARYTGSVNEFVGGLDQHTASIVRDLAGASGELRDTTEDLQEILNRFIKNLPQVSGSTV